MSAAGAAETRKRPREWGVAQDRRSRPRARVAGDTQALFAMPLIDEAARRRAIEARATLGLHVLFNRSKEAEE